MSAEEPTEVSAAGVQREDLIVQCALPAWSRFDKSMHLRITEQVHTHMTQSENAQQVTCEGPGGDLFFFMRHYKLSRPKK